MFYNHKQEYTFTKHYFYKHSHMKHFTILDSFFKSLKCYILYISINFVLHRHKQQHLSLWLALFQHVNNVSKGGSTSLKKHGLFNAKRFFQTVQCLTLCDCFPSSGNISRNSTVFFSKLGAEACHDILPVV